MLLFLYVALCLDQPKTDFPTDDAVKAARWVDDLLDRYKGNTGNPVLDEEKRKERTSHFERLVGLKINFRVRIRVLASRSIKGFSQRATVSDRKRNPSSIYLFHDVEKGREIIPVPDDALFRQLRPDMEVSVSGEIVKSRCLGGNLYLTLKDIKVSIPD